MTLILTRPLDLPIHRIYQSGRTRADFWFADRIPGHIDHVSHGDTRALPVSMIESAPRLSFTSRNFLAQSSPTNIPCVTP